MLVGDPDSHEEFTHCLVLRRNFVKLSTGSSVTTEQIVAGFLFALARSAFRGALDKTDRSLTPVPGNDWKVGIMFSLANPAGIAFWSGVGGGTFGATTNAGGRGSRRDSHKFHCGFNTLRRSVRRFDRTRAPTRDWQRDALDRCALRRGAFVLRPRLLWTSTQRAFRWLSPALRAMS